MISPNKIITELQNIREAVNRIEIKGEQNANYILFSCQKCDMLIEAINEIIKNSQNQNESDKEGE